MFGMESKFYFGRTIFTLVAILVGIMRFWLLSHELGHHAFQSYQAVSHIIVGILIGGCVFCGKKWDGFQWAFTLVTLLSIIEVTCVIIGLKN